MAGITNCVVTKTFRQLNPICRLQSYTNQKMIVLFIKILTTVHFNDTLVLKNHKAFKKGASGLF